MALAFRVPHGPAGWQMCMGLYAGCNAIALFLSPRAFQDNPIWRAIASLNIPQFGVAVILGGYAVASIFCLFFGRRYKLAALASFGIALWVFLGVEMIAGAAAAGFVSGAGLFELFAGFGCAVCLVQWSR